MPFKAFVRSRKLLLRKARTWLGRPLPEKLWLLPAWPLLGLVRLTQCAVPFRHLAPLLGHDFRTAACVPLANGSQMKRAEHIGRAISIAARHTPWESECLVQAMAARVMLGLSRLPYALFLGVRKGEAEPLQAHAWVCTGAVAVTGGRDTGVYTVVRTFVARSWVGRVG